MTIDAELMRALAGEMTPKFMGTLDALGVPNCVPVTTTTVFDEHSLVFGEFLMNKTRKNLLACDKVSVAVITESFDTWSIQGAFLGFETAGDRVDFINRSPLFRYNAYTSIRAAGAIRIESVSAKTSLSKGHYLCDFLRCITVRRFLRANNRAPQSVPGAADRAPIMPRSVIEKFARFSAVRALTYVNEKGYPVTFATVACVPAGPNRLLLGDSLFRAHSASLVPGSTVAVSVLTREPVAYQVKGLYRGIRLGSGVVDLNECYSASPPLLGERLDRPS
jgi:hypothetical protein